MGVVITKDSIDLGLVTLDAAPMLKFYRDTRAEGRRRDGYAWW